MIKRRSVISKYLIFCSKFSVILLIPLALISACSQQADEWTYLIPESGLNGWIQRGGEASYQNQNGVIVGTTAVNTPNSFLCTAESYADFVLEYEVMVDSVLNSGVQIRSESRPDYENGRVHGYQIEIDPSDRAWSGGVYDEGRRGWLANLENNPVAQAAFKNGEWNHFRVWAKGDSIRTWVNGVSTAVLKDDMTASGFIGLQVHSTNSKDPLRVMWRSIRVKELGD